MSSKPGDDRNHWWLITPASKREALSRGRNCWFYTKSIGFRFSEAISGGDRFRLAKKNKINVKHRHRTQKENVECSNTSLFAFEVDVSAIPPAYRFIYSMMRFPLFERKMTQAAIRTFSMRPCHRRHNGMALNESNAVFAGHYLSGVYAFAGIVPSLLRFMQSEAEEHAVVLCTCIWSSVGTKDEDAIFISPMAESVVDILLD